MRIRQLNLIRYGCFTNVLVDLPPSNPDIHILVGPNEAGKSTIQAGLEDLLFGIPIRSRMAFIHSYRDMRIGATVESDRSSLTVQRRKGSKDTLLDEKGMPLAKGELALAPFLGNATRERFERLFSLDHERLRRGGKEILEAKGDLGEALFSASSGFQDLRRRGRAIADEAEQLWKRRRSAKRTYYQADDRLRAAERDIRQHRVNVPAWRRLRDKVDHWRDEYNELGRRISEIDQQLRKLSRIRRVARLVGDKATIDRELHEMGPVPTLPENARETLRAAEEDERVAVQGAEEQQKDLERTRAERNRLSWDESLLLRSDDVDNLHERRLQVRASRSDLPKRVAELDAARRTMRALASELGWEDDRVSDLIERLPSRSSVANVRNRLNARAARMVEVKAARKALNEARRRRAEARRSLSEAEQPADVSQLRAVVSAIRQESGDVPSQIRSTQSALNEAEASAQALLARLRPALDSVESAETLPVPSVREVQSHEATRVRLNRELERIEDRISTTEKQLRTAKKVRDRIVANERPVGQRDVAILRSRRDSGWQLVRRRYIESERVPEEEIRAFLDAHSSLPWAYEQAVLAADDGADRRVETANAAARLEQAESTVRSLLQSLEAVQEEKAAAEQRGRAADTSWHALWESAPFEPLPPDGMLAWLDTLERLREVVAQQQRSRRALVSLRRQESAATESVLSELRALGVDTGDLASAGLLAVLERGADVRQHHEKAAQAVTALETESTRAVAAVDAKRAALEQAQSGLSAWQAEWAQAVAELGIPGSENPESVQAQLEVIDDMRPVVSDIESFRDRRVEPIRRDIQQFEQDVRTLVAGVAPDLSEWNPDEAALELERRVATARQARKDAEAKDKAIRTLEQRIQKSEKKRRKARQSIVALETEAGARDVEELRLVIDKTKRATRLRADRSTVVRNLSDAGDGFSVERLEEECREVDLDQAASREKELRPEIEELRNLQATARDRLREAEGQFQRVGGGDAAAVAEGDRQSALAEIREIAQRYVRRRAAALLLQWAVDRERRERQGPMLQKAGELFAELTAGSFEALELDFDESDKPRLVGRRPSGERVNVEGMSSGSVDQLYLALRVAALENHTGESGTVPFLADDLFVNFDDVRAAAGFRVLSRLAAKHQVMFLTHHEHLVEVAKSALRAPVRVWTLPGGMPPARAAGSS